MLKYTSDMDEESIQETRWLPRQGVAGISMILVSLAAVFTNSNILECRSSVFLQATSSSHVEKESIFFVVVGYELWTR